MRAFLHAKYGRPSQGANRRISRSSVGASMHGGVRIRGAFFEGVMHALRIRQMIVTRRRD